MSCAANKWLFFALFPHFCQHNTCFLHFSAIIPFAMSLDQTDRQILQLLQHDARLTNKEIADKLGKTISPIYERIKWLEQQGFIKKYIALADRNLLGLHLVAFTNVQLKEHAQAMLQAFEREVVKLPEVLECYHMTGMYDYLLKVVVSDMNHYQSFIVNKLAKLPNIGTVQSSFIMTEVKYQLAYPVTVPEETKKPARKNRTT
jgi:Lrp/AsnC family leucine-responsive transcriptional regulator